MQNSVNIRPLFLAASYLMAIMPTFAVAQSSFTSGAIFTASASDCANACSRDNSCATWIFVPMKVSGGASAGQCQFTNNPNIGSISGAITGKANRGAPIEQKQLNAKLEQNASLNETAHNYYQGNYSVQPWGKIAKTAAVAPQYQVQPQPLNLPKNDAAISYEQPKAYIPPQAIKEQNLEQQALIAPPKVQTYQAPAKVETPKAIAEAPKVLGPLHATPKPIVPPPAPNLQAYVGKDGMIDAAEMRRLQIKEQAKYGGSYSVQKEWQDVAQAMQNGENTSGIDWANTTPIPLPEEKKQQSEKQNYDDEAQVTKPKKKSLFGWLNQPKTQKNADASESQGQDELKNYEMPISNNTGGPLRKR